MCEYSSDSEDEIDPLKFGVSRVGLLRLEDVMDSRPPLQWLNMSETDYSTFVNVLSGRLWDLVK